MRIVVIVIALILAVVMCIAGAILLLIGIKVLQGHDDALLHPPDPDHIQWPDEDGDDL